MIRYQNIPEGNKIKHVPLKNRWSSTVRLVISSFYSSMTWEKLLTLWGLVFSSKIVSLLSL